MWLEIHALYVSDIAHYQLVTEMCVLPFVEESWPSCYKLWISGKQKNGEKNEKECDGSFRKSARGKNEELRWNQAFVLINRIWHHALLYWAQFSVVLIDNSFGFCFCGLSFVMFIDTQSVYRNICEMYRSIVHTFVAYRWGVYLALSPP